MKSKNIFSIIISIFVIVLIGLGIRALVKTIQQVRDANKYYTVTFDSNGGTYVESVKVKNNSYVAQPSDPYKEGYILQGWLLNGKLYDFSSPVKSDMNLVAQYIIDESAPPTPIETFTVTFNTDGGSYVSPQSIEKGNTAREPSKPTKSGYDFVEWQLNGTGYYFGSPVNENITLTATWKKSTTVEDKYYTVTFDSDGGSSVSPIQVKEGDAAVEPTAPTRNGYIFVSWLSNGKGYDFTKPVKSDITLTAKWEKDSTVVDKYYTVKFDSNGGSSVDSIQVKEGDTAVEPGNPTRNGYSFVSWQLDGSAYDFTKPVKSNITLKAKWKKDATEKYYTVTFDSNGGSTIAPAQVKEGDTVVEPTPPTRKGYSFVRWLLDGSAYDFTTPVKSNITLTAKWKKDAVEVKYYTVTFDSNGGSDVASQSIKENTLVTKPTNPTRSGYKFNGWYDGDTKFDFNTKINKEYTLTASWLKKYTVTFDSDGGTSVDPKTVVEGKTLAEPTGVTRSGYTLNYWTLNGEQYNFSSPVTDDITLIAHWTKVTTYTVTFDSNGGSSVKAQTVKSGAKVTKPTDPTRTYYLFKYWSLNGKEYDFSTKVKENFTLIAEWQKNAYTIKFYLSEEDDDYIKKIKVIKGKAIGNKFPEDPEKDGYEFVGWTDADGNEYDSSTVPTKSIRLYANFEEE